jgi:hypothetical protein
MFFDVASEAKMVLDAFLSVDHGADSTASALDSYCDFVAVFYCRGFHRHRCRLVRF